MKKAIIRILFAKDLPSWWKEKSDRNKDGCLFPEIAQDLERVVKNSTQKNEKGELVGKYNFVATNLSPKPKTLQGRGKKKTKYINVLANKIKERKDLKKFKNKEIGVFICVYLRESKYLNMDVDNCAKPILDALKTVVGDDSLIIKLIIKKKKLKGYDKKDLDFIEQSLLIVAEPDNIYEITRGI